MPRRALVLAAVTSLSAVLGGAALPSSADAACSTCTGGSIQVRVSKATEGRTFTDWGYDIKQPGKAAELAQDQALRDRVYGTDRMTVLRIPVYATKDVNPSQKAAINPGSYAPVIAAVSAVKAEHPGVKIFASLKLGKAHRPETTFAPWLFRSKQVDPARYAGLLRKNLAYLSSQGVKVDVLGVDNEAALNGGEISAADHRQIVARLDKGLAKDDVAEPRYIAPENYFPDVARIKGLAGSSSYTYAGTHFYSKLYAKQAPQLNAFAAQARQHKKTLWDSEFHWNVTHNNSTSWTQALADAFPALRSAFLHLDDGFTGMTWWSFQTASSGKPWGQMHEKLVQTTNGAAVLKPGAVHDRDGSSVDSKLLTRGFVDSDAVNLWVVNSSTTTTKSQKISVKGALLGGRALVTTYSKKGAETSEVATTDSGVTVRVPARSVVVIEAYFPVA